MSDLQEVLKQIKKGRVAKPYANLEGANLGSANFRNANLWRADLGNANLRNADLRDAYLGNADLRGVKLGNANLRNADLRGANLGNANLRNADLRGAYLGNAYLGNADLWCANLGNVDLRGAILEDAKLEDAKGIVHFPNIGSRGDSLYVVLFWEHAYYFKTGCFWGTRQEFILAVRKRHGHNQYAKAYMKALGEIKKRMKR